MSGQTRENTSENDALSVSIAENTNVIPIAKTTSVKLTDAGGGGDCFYLSVYESLKSQGYLEAFNSAFGPTPDNISFVKRFRLLISNECESLLKNFYKEMCTKAAGSPDDFASLLAINAIPDWLVVIIKKYISTDNLSCLEQDAETITLFISECQAQITKMGNWAGELETKAAKNILSRIGVYLEIKNRVMPRLALVPGRIVLCNLGEAHYQYYSYNMKGGRKTKKSLRKNRRNRKTRK